MGRCIPSTNSLMRTLTNFTAVLGVSICLNAAALSTEDSVKLGETPPPLQLSRMVQGGPIQDAAWEKLKGKVVVLEFWNTRCGPCIKAIPHLNELIDQFSARDVVFLSVSDDNPDHLKRFLKQHPVKGWLALDGPFEPTAAAFGVTGIPHTVIVDRNGRVAAITHPALVQAKHLEEVLAGKPCSLPLNLAPSADTPTEAVTNFPPTSIAISIEGPFPQPNGAFGLRRWKQDGHVFEARKASLVDALSTFFQVSPKLISQPALLPAGLYNISAEAPPGQIAELRLQLADALKAKWGITVEAVTEDVKVYSLSVVASNMPSFKPAQKRAGGGESPGGFRLGGSSMSSIASLLESNLDRPVVDETGLQGLWAAEVRWKMSESDLASDDKPDPERIIQAAREQLGLELRPAVRKMPVLNVRKTYEVIE
jgi:uncharacterized protein (TIGR03435 family)